MRETLHHFGTLKTNYGTHENCSVAVEDSYFFSPVFWAFFPIGTSRDRCFCVPTVKFQHTGNPFLFSACEVHESNGECSDIEVKSSWLMTCGFTSL